MEHVFRGLFIVAALLLASCNYNISKQTFKGPDNFATIKAQLFQPYCMRCHDGEEAQDFSNYPSLLEQNSEGQNFMTPGNPAESRIYEAMMAGDMPPQGTPPSAEMMEKVRVWIENGAPEN